MNARFVCTHRCGNGVLDDGETDVDCGGVCLGTDRVHSPYGGCRAGKKCLSSLDCGVGSSCQVNHGRAYSAMKCIGGICVGHCQNGVRDEAETDVDCGYDPARSGCFRGGGHGEGCEPCDVGKQCVTNADCRSGLCAVGACVAGPTDAGTSD